MNNNANYLLNNYNTYISGISKVGMLLGFLGLFHLCLSYGFDLLRQNPLGIISDSSCVPGSEAVVELKYFHFISICGSFLAGLLAKAARFNFQSHHDIVLRFWVLLCEAILAISYLFFYKAIVGSLQLILGSVYCATDSHSSDLAVMLGVIFSVVFMIVFIIRCFSPPLR